MLVTKNDSSLKPQPKSPNLNFQFQLFPKPQTINRRLSIPLLFHTLLLPKTPIFNIPPANAIDLRIVVPDQTAEEALSVINGHAESLVQVKDLFDSPFEEWKEARKALRKRASLLKQDIYTIIQSKPGGERPMLRKLYSSLFNNVTAMDFAARDGDVSRVSECYRGIVSSLDEILARI